MPTQTVACPKCDGQGFIGAFGHVANGVCFMCEGSKLVQVDIFQAKISPENRVKAEWIVNSTDDSYVGLSYGKLLKIRDFAHSGFGFQQAFPTMLSTWREYGEAFFQAAQSERLDAMRANR